MSEELEILRERAQEYRALLELSYVLLKKKFPTTDEKALFFRSLSEHGIIEKKPEKVPLPEDKLYSRRRDD